MFLDKSSIACATVQHNDHVPKQQVDASADALAGRKQQDADVRKRFAVPGSFRRKRKVTEIRGDGELLQARKSKVKSSTCGQQCLEITFRN
jgi:hypothetical protein